LEKSGPQPSIANRPDPIKKLKGRKKAFAVFMCSWSS
jgi:hypothetical protein